jgi:hypothetical protein
MRYFQTRQQRSDYLECALRRRKSNTASLPQSLERDMQKTRDLVACSYSTNVVPRNNSRQCVRLERTSTAEKITMEEHTIAALETTLP